ncbi:Uncharacterised protein [Shigella sonnei]|nr:Uncharacterised protein [Shigella sonnei]CSR98212.1 Uncharacterised protein [Shigella sonnei]
MTFWCVLTVDWLQSDAGIRFAFTIMNSIENKGQGKYHQETNDQ